MIVFPCLVKAQGRLSAEEFIVKVLSEQKNPFAYIPFNRALFLPTEEEQSKLDFERSYPKKGLSLGSIIFLSKDDSTYHRETFVDAYVATIERFASPKGRIFSVKDNEAFFKRKQQYHLSKYPNAGRFRYNFAARKPD